MIVGKSSNRISLLMVKSLVRLFFQDKYLTGRHFDKGDIGYRWALTAIWTRNILRLAPPNPWPASHLCKVGNWRNIIFHQDDLNNFQAPGTYYQSYAAKIYIGRGSYIAPNVGLITANHSIMNLEDHDVGSDIIIGDNCWIGMNAVILPGVQLGERTIVAAGAVVTKSFSNGSVLIGGVPAEIIRNL